MDIREMERLCQEHGYEVQMYHGANLFAGGGGPSVCSWQVWQRIPYVNRYQESYSKVTHCVLYAATYREALEQLTALCVAEELKA